MRCHPVISDRTHLRAGWLACAALRTALIRVVRSPDARGCRARPGAAAFRRAEPAIGRSRRPRKPACSTNATQPWRALDVCTSRPRARCHSHHARAGPRPPHPHDRLHFSARTTALAPLADRRHSLGVVADRGGADVAAAQLRRSKPRAIEPEGFESPKYRQKTGNKKPRQCAVSAKHGGRGGNRTPDTGIFNPLLYQLSYPAR